MSNTNVRLTSNSVGLLVNKSVFAEELDITRINVTDDVYVNSQIYTPVGSVITYAGSSAPGGWLLCDGSEVSKMNYPRLFSVIGTTYGTSSDSAKFVLPNLADRIPVGKSGSNSIGNTGGNSSVTLSTSQMPAHVHTGTSDNDGLHYHTGSSDSAGSHTHGISDPGHAHSQWTNQDDYNSSGGNPPSFAGDAGTVRTWYNINSSTTGISVNSAGNHTHTFTSNTTGSHAHEFTTDSTGGDNSVDIRNKYIVLNYIIRY